MVVLGVRERIVLATLRSVRTAPWDTLDLIDVERIIMRRGGASIGDIDAATMSGWLGAMSPAQHQALIDLMNEAESKSVMLHHDTTAVATN
jgi:hypothetical protein